MAAMVVQQVAGPPALLPVVQRLALLPVVTPAPEPLQERPRVVRLVAQQLVAPLQRRRPTRSGPSAGGRCTPLVRMARWTRASSRT